jgi:hypothetical protein
MIELRGVGGLCVQRTPLGNGSNTGLVQEDNQVRLGATRYPIACLYTCGTVLLIAQEGNKSLYH